MNEEQRIILANTWLEKADAATRDARILKENGSLEACINRLYYAVFYAASAVLASRGQSYGKHAAVRAAVHRDFVNTGLLDKEHGRIYDILMSRREDADYQPAASFSLDEIEDYCGRAKQMIEVMKRLAVK